MPYIIDTFEHLRYLPPPLPFPVLPSSPSSLPPSFSLLPPLPLLPSQQCQVMDHPYTYKYRCVGLSCKYKLCHLSGSSECREQQHSSPKVTQLPKSLVRRMAWNMAVHTLVPGKLISLHPFGGQDCIPYMYGFSLYVWLLPKLRISHQTGQSMVALVDRLIM